MSTETGQVHLHLDPVAEASEFEEFAEVSLGPVFVGVRGLQRALRSPIDVVAFGDRTFLIAEVAWSVWPPLSLYLRWRHAPRFDGIQLRTDDDVVLGVSMDVLFR